MAPEVFRARMLEVPRDVPIIEAVQRVFAPVIEQIQADRELWLLPMRVIKNSPSLLPALFARGLAEEEQFVAAFRVAMMRWSAAGPGAALSDFVREAFGQLAAGLTDPTPTSTEVE